MCRDSRTLDFGLLTLDSLRYVLEFLGIETRHYGTVGFVPETKANTTHRGETNMPNEIKSGIVDATVYVESGPYTSSRPRGNGSEKFEYFRGKMNTSDGGVPSTVTVTMSADQEMPKVGEVYKMRISITERPTANQFREFASLFASLGKVINVANAEEISKLLGLHTIAVDVTPRVLVPRAATAPVRELA